MKRINWHFFWIDRGNNQTYFGEEVFISVLAWTFEYKRDPLKNTFNEKPVFSIWFAILNSPKWF